MNKLTFTFAVAITACALTTNGFAAPQSDTKAPNAAESWCSTPQLNDLLSQHMTRNLSGKISEVDARKGTLKIETEIRIPFIETRTQQKSTRTETRTIEVELTKNTVLQKIVLRMAPRQPSDLGRPGTPLIAQIERLQIAEIKVGQNASLIYELPLANSMLPTSDSASLPARVMASTLIVVQKTIESSTQIEVAKPETSSGVMDDTTRP